MNDLPGFSDSDIERLLAGKAPAGGDRLDAELAAFARDVRTAFLAPAPPEVEREHLAAAVQAARLAGTANPRAKPARRASRPVAWRRRTVLSSVFVSLSAKIAGVAIAATAAAGGLAAAGALPAPVQSAVASAASNVGLNLPNPNADKGQDQKESHAPGAPTSMASDEASGVNHGNCVSYAAGLVDSLGLSGRAKGEFMSDIAKDSKAVSAKVPDGGKADKACQTAIDAAKADAKALDSAGNEAPTATVHEGGNGTDHESPTATVHEGGNGNGNGSGNQAPTATAHDGGAGSNPTGNGSDSHPTATSNPGTTHKP